MDQHPISVSPPSVLPRAAALHTLSAALRLRGYDFVTVTPATHRSVNARPENFWARDMHGVFGWSRPFRPGALDPELFRLAQNASTLREETHAGEACWRATVRASTLRGQIFLHTAFPTDASDAVFFGPDTYRFADAVMHTLQHRTRPIARAVDIGCGSGAAGILVALAYPRATVTLTDINGAALAMATENARAAGAANTFCLQSDLFAELPGDFDLVVANPPYLVDEAARTYRHGGGHRGEGLSLRILRDSLQHLAPGGQLILYTGSAIANGQDFLRQEAATLLENAGWPWIYREIDPDVFGEELGYGAYTDAERIAAVVITAERPA